MPLYKLECDGCGEQWLREMTFEEHDVAWKMKGGAKSFGTHSVMLAHDDQRFCGSYRQVFDFHINLGMREHYSDQLDMHVTSERQYTSALSRQQDEYRARTGLDAKFDTIDPNDQKAAGVTDAGLESQERALHAETSDGHKSIFT